VLSRCLQFNLKRLSVPLISGRIKTILGAEGIAFDDAAVQLVAEAADGSMRDGLSLLDQLLAFGGGKVAEDEARAMLATVDRRQVARLAGLLAEGDPAPLLDYAKSLEEWSPDHGEVLDALATLLVRVALRQALPAYEGDDLYPSALLADLAARITPEDVQLYYQTAILGRRDLAWAPDARSGFEMTLLRMLAFRPGPVASTAAPAPVAATAGAGAAAVAGGGAKARPVVARSTLDDWSATLAQLEIGGAVRQLASHCAYAGRDGAVVRLSLDPAQQTLRTTALVEKLAQALTRHLGETVKVEIGIAQSEPDTPARAQDRDAEARLAAARRSLEEDPTVRAFRDKFGATIKPDSIRPT
jgi:DNA polymerase-3 subunit gamma/tau